MSDINKVPMVVGLVQALLFVYESLPQLSNAPHGEPSCISILEE